MAIVKTGTVKYPANKAFPDQYNEGKFKQSIVLQMDDGSEETLWFTQGRTPHANLPKGTAVQVLFEEWDGKMTRKLIDNSQSTPTNQPQSQATPVLLSDTKKKEVADYIKQQTDLLRYCWDIAGDKFEGKIQSEETLRHFATTIYSSAKDKFNF